MGQNVPWFKIYFSLFKTHYHTLSCIFIPKNKGKENFEPRKILTHNICKQKIKKKLFAERMAVGRRHKINCLQQVPHIKKKCLQVKIFQPSPRQKNNGLSLTILESILVPRALCTVYIYVIHL